MNSINFSSGSKIEVPVELIKSDTFNSPSASDRYINTYLDDTVRNQKAHLVKLYDREIFVLESNWNRPQQPEEKKSHTASIILMLAILGALVSHVIYIVQGGGSAILIGTLCLGIVASVVVWGARSRTRDSHAPRNRYIGVSEATS